MSIFILGSGLIVGMSGGASGAASGGTSSISVSDIIALLQSEY